MPQPAAQVVDLDSVHQQVARVAVLQGVRAYLASGHDRPSSSALLTAALTQRHAVDGWTSTSFPWLMLPWERADLSAACSPRWIGTTLDLLPLPARARSVGGSASRERSETSSVSASAMRRPALHCSISSSLALGLSVALMAASTSWASRYSGSFLSCAELSDLRVCAPRTSSSGHRLGCHGAAAPCKECSERFLQIGSFSSSLRSGRS